MKQRNENFHFFDINYANISWNYIFETCKLLKVDLNHVNWYISGPEFLVNSILPILNDHEIKREKIFLEEHRGNIDSQDNMISLLKAQDSGIDIFKLAIESLNLHVILTDSEGRIVFANKAAQEITGYTFEEMKGSTPRLWGGLMNADFYKSMWNNVKNNKKSFETEVVNMNKKGDLYTCFVKISPLLSNTGEVIGFIGSEFITSRYKQLEIELKNNLNDVEKLNRLMVDRETKMIDLKKEIERLKGKV